METARLPPAKSRQVLPGISLPAPDSPPPGCTGGTAAMRDFPDKPFPAQLQEKWNIAHPGIYCQINSTRITLCKTGCIHSISSRNIDNTFSKNTQNISFFLAEKPAVNRIKTSNSNVSGVQYQLHLQICECYWYPVFLTVKSNPRILCGAGRWPPER